jgi:hypothetical protein
MFQLARDNRQMQMMAIGKKKEMTGVGVVDDAHCICMSHSLDNSRSRE